MDPRRLLDLCSHGMYQKVVVLGRHPTAVLIPGQPDSFHHQSTEFKQGLEYETHRWLTS